MNKIEFTWLTGHIHGLTDKSCKTNIIWQIVHDSWMLTQPEMCKLQQVCCRLDSTCNHQADIRMCSHCLHRLDNIKSVASCELQTWCKLWIADLMQVVNCRLAAHCELQAWCKLWTADLMQVVNCRLDAICELQTWYKLSSTDLMQVVKRQSEEAPYKASCIHYFEQKKRPSMQVAIFRLYCFIK